MGLILYCWPLSLSIQLLWKEKTSNPVKTEYEAELRLREDVEHLYLQESPERRARELKEKTKKQRSRWLIHGTRRRDPLFIDFFLYTRNCYLLQGWSLGLIQSPNPRTRRRMSEEKESSQVKPPSFHCRLSFWFQRQWALVKCDLRSERRTSTFRREQGKVCKSLARLPKISPKIP